MSTYDIDRTLADWFESEAEAPASPDVLARALAGARQRRPRPTMLAGPGSHWGWTPWPGGSSAGVAPWRSVRRSTALVVVLLIGAVLGGALLVGARLLDTPPPLPAAHLGSLAYAVDGDIFVADWDGANPVRIADGLPGGKSGCGSAGYWAEGPMWSPDGRHLVYRSPRSQTDCDRPEADTFPTILVSDPAGNVVAEVPGVGWLIPWSPDSTRFATWLDLYPSTKIGVYGVDGVRQAVLELPPALYGTISGDFDPAWSPDGASILVVVYAGEGMSEVWEVPVDGGPPRPLPADHPRSRWGSTLSPDGAQIAFVDDRSQGYVPTPAPELVVAAADGSTPRVLASDVDQQWSDYPVWSPTGDRIAFVAGDGREVQVVDVASGDIKTLVRADGLEGVSVINFSPEGDRILFTRHTLGVGLATSVWSVDATGSAPQLLIDRLVDWDAGDWQSLRSE